MDWIFALTLNNFVFCLFSGVIERHESRLDYKINYFPEQFLSRYLSVVEFLMILIYILYYYFFCPMCIRQNRSVNSIRRIIFFYCYCYKNAIFTLTKNQYIMPLIALKIFGRDKCNVFH